VSKLASDTVITNHVDLDIINFCLIDYMMSAESPLKESDSRYGLKVRISRRQLTGHTASPRGAAILVASQLPSWLFFA
jgi:hypothetical protein